MKMKKREEMKKEKEENEEEKYSIYIENREISKKKRKKLK